MRLFFLSIRQLGAIGVLLVGCLALVLLHASRQTRWDLLTRDTTDGVLQIPEVRMLTSFPATIDEFVALTPAAAIELSIPIKVANRSAPIGNATTFPDEVRKSLGDNFPRGDLRFSYIMFVDIDSADLRNLDRPHLFFHRMYGEWVVYANDERIGSGSSEDRYVAIPIAITSTGTVRIAWHVQNRSPSRFEGPDSLLGVSIRSAANVNNARLFLPMQLQIPRVVATSVLLCLAAVSLVLALSSPRFLDLWAFASFCAALAFSIWVQTPFYWESFSIEQSGRSDDWAVARAISHSHLVLTATVLSLAFFRVRGYFLHLIVSLTIASLAIIVYQTWPYGSELPPFRQYQLLDSKLVAVLWCTQIVSMTVGTYIAARQALEFRRQGLIAFLKPMWRRAGEALTYSLAMILMLWVYADALPKQSTTSGPDLFLLYGLLPALAMLIQFYWMMTASQRFRERMSPRLDYVDFLVHTLGEVAYEDSYTGALARFDLKGFKSFTRIKEKSARHARAVDRFIMTMRSDLESVVSRGHTVFRFKTNGDENIWTIFAKDDSVATATLRDIVQAWHAQSSRLLEKWKSEFKSAVGQGIDGDDVAVLANIDLHAMFCVLRNMRIDPVGDAKHPDYICDSFTLLSEAFKTSLHNRVAMYRDEAQELIPMLSDARFEPSGDGHPDSGFLAWGAAGDSSKERAAG